MLLTILGILLVVGVIWLVIYVLETYFPTLARLWKAAIIATVVLGFVRLIGAWLCSLVCR
jgi:hypothetical protein